jgi:hypothetical protein
VDVSGAWEGPFRFDPGGRAVSLPSAEQTTRWVLQQKGAKVRGEVQGLDGAPLGSVEGLVNGEVFSWTLTGSFVSMAGSGNLPNRSWHGEATVNSDELSGRADGPACPCAVLLHRVGSAIR